MAENNDRNNAHLQDEGNSILNHFDVRKVNSSAISISTPATFAQQLKVYMPSGSAEEEDLKLRLITNGLVAARLLEITPPWLADLDELLLSEEGFSPSLVTTIEDTAFLKVQDWMFVMAPKVENEAEVVKFLRALSEAELDNRGAAYWIFDFSSVTYVNHALIAFLIGFKQNLLCATPAISLLWLRPEIIPPSLLATTKKRFNLFKKGLFLLSQGNRALENQESH